MVDYEQEIKKLEDELRNTAYNKATEHHFGVVKAKIAKLREKVEKRRGIGKSSIGFYVKKSGDASVVILGFPSVGKSTLLNKVTGAKSEIGAYEFTTLDVVPGVLTYNSAKIQLLDIPGIIKGAAAGKGRGKEILGMVRNADLILVLIDAQHPEHHNAILKEIYDAGIRINQDAPDVKIKKKSKGGLDIASTVKLTKMNPNTIKAILREFRIANADIVIRTDIDMDQFIDAIEANRVYIPSITAITKIDLIKPDQLKKLKKKLKADVLVSCAKNQGIEELKEAIFQQLGFIRIFLKEINKQPDLDEPLILRKGATIKNVCEKIHRTLLKKFKYVRIWGKTAKFPGQQIQKLDKEITDGDIIEVHSS